MYMHGLAMNRLSVHQPVCFAIERVGRNCRRFLRAMVALSLIASCDMACAFGEHGLADHARRVIAQSENPDWGGGLLAEAPVKPALPQQGEWHGRPVIAELSTEEKTLVAEVVTANVVLIGRGDTIKDQPGFNLDAWLLASGFKWNQRWQDVYSAALYIRTSVGLPVTFMPGADWTRQEVAAAEAGARKAAAKSHIWIPR